ncbi:MAG: hypothetical protein N2169_06655 [bacterium]|nr:hypothetical protein [bacterium]
MVTKQLKDIFYNSQIEQLINFLDNLFAQIPFEWYTNTFQIDEDISSTGNIGLTVLHQNTAYIFEFKVEKRKSY